MDELTEMRRLRAEVPADLDLAAAETRFLAELKTEGHAPRRRLFGGWRPLGGSRLLRPVPLVTVAAVAAAGAVVASHLGSDHGGGPDTVQVASVSALMDRAAAAALKDPLPAPRPDQYLYQEAQETRPADASGGESWLDRQYVWTWQSINGTRPDLIRHRTLAPLPIPGRPLPPAATGPAPAAAETLTEPCGTRPPIDRPYLDAVPADPDALLRLLDDGGDGDRGDRLWERASDVLVSSAAPPQVRAALYRAIARIPGVRLVADSVDAAGRHGVAVARVQDGVRIELIFDRAGYRFLGERGIVVDGGADGPAGTLVSSSAVLRVSVVDAPPKAGPKAEHADC
ncbi:CU044_5270 family protein [Actinomadura fibrosa]|uniref:CU044_5270 family protein n=1 Tax=Actinomadura fibrosa TaxID=111802 RepID=A0ABW2XVB4_9ACTN|nr:CU044_5270 family protein [Actinomadura fibrosa]